MAGHSRLHYVKWAKRHPIIVALPLIAAIAWLEVITRHEMRLAVIYLIPVIAVAWMGSRTQSAISVIASAASRLAADYAWKVPLWNGFAWVMVYVAVAFLVRRILLDRAKLETVNMELQRALTRESNLARTDPLTGLPNSRSFLEHLGRELARARRENQAVCVLFLDLDDFKAVNDRYGHAAGDDVLAAIGRLILETVRAGDMVARLGGDEFVVLLWHTPREEAVHVAERIRSRVAEFAADYPKTRLGVSVGIAWFAEPPSDPEDVLRAADHEMYEEKVARKSGPE
jgi:diguanylate cyclase (GGDEF)-like protein